MCILQHLTSFKCHFLVHKMSLPFPTSVFHTCVKTIKNVLVCFSAKIIIWPWILVSAGHAAHARKDLDLFLLRQYQQICLLHSNLLLLWKSVESIEDGTGCLFSVTDPAKPFWWNAGRKEGTSLDSQGIFMLWTNILLPMHPCGWKKRLPANCPWLLFTLSSLLVKIHVVVFPACFHSHWAQPVYRGWVVLVCHVV